MVVIISVPFSITITIQGVKVDLQRTTTEKAEYEKSCSDILIHASSSVQANGKKEEMPPCVWVKRSPGCPKHESKT